MDRNFLLFMAFSLGIILVWQSLFAPPPAAVEPAANEPPAVVREDPEAAARDALHEAVPAPAPETPESSRSETVSGDSAPPVRKVTIRQPLFEAVFTSEGGGLESFLLSEYTDRKAPGEPPIDMVTLGKEWNLALATPLKGLGLGNLSRLRYEVSQPDANTLVFSRTVRGLTIRKRYLFSPDAYLFRLRIEIDNGTDRHVSPTFTTLWPARAGDGTDFDEFNLGVYTDDELKPFAVVAPPMAFFGGSGSDERETFPSDVEWAGAHTRYFLAALVPDKPSEVAADFTPVEVGREALLQVTYAPTDVPPNGRLDREFKVYLGPKEAERLDAVGAHLDEAILKGWFPALTRFFANLIHTGYEFVGNYGVAIILITILVRLLMAPLMTRQMKSMKKIGAMQPEIKEVQAKFPDDRQAQSEAMMAVYKKHGLSPFSMFSGCLPMFLQLPVFIGFYYALQGSILLRQQPFFGWIDDLSQPESLFTLPGIDLPVRVIPLLMGASMFLQQKLAPQTAMDPAQARMMLWMMPIMFTVMFYQFASGLVLYWFVSTLIGIGQQAITNRSKD